MRQVLHRTGLIISGVALLAAALLPSPRANALSGAEFDAGRIIDNGVFENRNTMGVNEIQNFLNSKVPVCDNWGTKTYSGSTTRRQYSESRGVTFPLTCAKDYYENPTTHANNLSGNPIPSGGISAAQIIFNASQQYFINPQVLIVLLQKEQTLVTDDWPWPTQFNKATGYGCPDSAACDTTYSGFYNQVQNAARQFRRYADNPNNYNYVPNQNNTIKWNPNSGCGSSTVYLQDQSTASLYNYTPYRPNQAALNNLYGSGDSCSSYGNRNFWRYFRDWFGTTYADPFMWQPTGMTIMDEGKNVVLPTDYLHKGERLWVEVTGVNLGTEIWYRDGVNPARLGTWRNTDHSSDYCDVLWLPISNACNRSAKLVEASVAPGETFHFQFYIHAPNQGGQFRDYYRRVLEGRAWMTNETGFHIYVNSGNTYEWAWEYFDAYTDNTKTTRVNVDNLAKNQQFYVEAKVKNNSATVWQNSGPNPVRMGTQNPQDSMSPVCTPDWPSCNRTGTMNEATVKPGEEATFGFTVKAPGSLGVYKQYIRPVIEYQGWMRDNTQSNLIYFNVTH